MPIPIYLRSIPNSWFQILWYWHFLSGLVEHLRLTWDWIRTISSAGYLTLITFLWNVWCFVNFDYQIIYILIFQTHKINFELDLYSCRPGPTLLLVTLESVISNVASRYRYQTQRIGCIENWLISNLHVWFGK